MKDNKMDRRTFLRNSVLGFTGMSMASSLMLHMSCNRADNAMRPNILLIVADDAGWNDVRYHGSEIKTPNIDELTKSGVELNRFYVCPTCSPTRASLLTGRFASRYGILGPISMKSKQTLPPDTVTLPGLLSRHGYTTAITGKWHLGLRPESGPGKYGFQHTYGYLHGQIDQYTHHYKNGDTSWHRNGEFLDEEGHATDLITNEAIRYMRELRDPSRPFFLYVPYSVPHYPLQEEQKWIEPYEKIITNESRRKFAASMTHMDHAIGRLIEVLEAENLRKNTLVIFISDNGGQESWTPTFEYNMKFSANDRLGDNSPLRDWKGSLYEGGIRVPACFNWPEKLKPGVSDQVGHAVDLLPTIASMIGIPIMSEMQIDGLNVWNQIAHDQTITERTLYWRTSGQYSIRKGNWKLVHTGNSLDSGMNELFNLSRDPNETQDVARSNPGILSDLLSKLREQSVSDQSLAKNME